MLSWLALPEVARQALILPVFLLFTLVLGRAIAGPLARVPVHSVLERLLVFWLLGLIALSWTGTVLAGLGLFRPWLMAACLALLAVGSLWKEQKGRLAAPVATPALEQTPHAVPWLVVLGLAIAAYGFARPAQTYFLYDDSSVYTIGGVLLARTGSLIARLDGFWQASDSFVRQFYTSDGFGLIARHYGPFYQWLPNSQTLEIGFLPLPKVWVALSAWLFGENYATWATPFFGVTGLAMLYGLARRSIGWLAGLAATALLGASLAQLWFARYPISEMYAQAFWLGGLYLAILARQNADDGVAARRLAFWSALALATLTVLRFEALLLLVPAAAFLLLGWSPRAGSWSRYGRVWALVLGLASAFGTAISVGVARHYVLAQTLATVTPGLVRFAILVLLLSMLGTGWLLYRRENVASAASWLPRLARWLPMLFAGAWAIWAIVAIWQIATRGLGDTVAGWLVQYWGALGVILSVAGALVLLRRQAKEQNRAELATALGLASLLLLSYAVAPRVYPTHPWAVRRLVPMVFPALALSAGGLLAAPVAYVWRARVAAVRPAKWAAPLAVVAVLAFLAQGLVLARASVPLLWHTEQGGYWQQLQAVASAVPPGALILLEPGPDGWHVGQAFELLFGHPSFVLSAEALAGDQSGADKLIGEALQQRRRVFLIINDNLLKWHPEQWQLAPMGERHIETEAMSYPAGRPPGRRDLTRRVVEFDMYEVLPKAGVADIISVASSPLAVTASAGAYPYLRDGFYGWDLGVDNRLVRWTNGAGNLALPWPGSTPSEPAQFCLGLELAGGRPAEEKPAHLSVMAEGREIFSRTMERDGRPVELAVPVDRLANQGSPQLEIQLNSSTWQTNWGAGLRPVGVALYGLKLLPYEQCAAGNQ